jgi:2',3'-cyclic-nucleotide 2'-phosphodiesterase (5'-nucleotidase family)
MLAIELFIMKVFHLTVALGCAFTLTTAYYVPLYPQAEEQPASSSGDFNITFFHINDVHAHLDEFNKNGLNCSDPIKGCYGGLARVQHVMKEARKGVQNSLFLNSGDEFQAGHLL